MKKFKQYIVGALFLPLLLGSCTSNFRRVQHRPQPSHDARCSRADSQSDRLPRIAPRRTPASVTTLSWACFGGYVTATNSWGRQFLYATYNIDDEWNKWSADWYFPTRFTATTSRSHV